MSTMLEEQEFQKEGIDINTWKKIGSILWEHKKHIIFLIITMFTTAAMDVFIPLLNRYAIDTYVIDRVGLEHLSYFVGIYVLAILVSCFSVYNFFTLASRVESDFGKNLRKKCFEKLQNQSFAYFDRTANGWLMARLTSDVARLAEIMAWSTVDLVWGIVVMFGISIVMLIINWQMALAVLFIVPIFWYVSLYFQRKILTAHRSTRKINSKITAKIAESINGAKTTKTLSLEEQNFNEFQSVTKDMRLQSLRAVRINATFQPIVYLLSSFAIAALLGVGGQSVLLKTIQFGTLSLFINYANTFFEPLKQIARIMAEMQMAQASAERIVGLLEEEVTIVDREDVIERYGTLLEPKTENYEEIKGDVQFSHVSFRYNEQESVLEDFNLDVQAGEMIALVGETGSGKSTIVNLLCRFYEPTSGLIRMDDKDIQDRSVGWLHSKLGYVLQSPHLFRGSIRDNIRYGNPQASDEAVEEVAKIVYAHEFIMRLEHGYDSEVGEGGDLLSTGEKQLISFARAILADPRIIILDEATSSIDTQSEKRIQEAIQAVLRGRTSFVVAHRLSTIVNADKILVLSHGKILEQGTHDALIQKQGAYYSLFTSQALQAKEKELLAN